MARPTSGPAPTAGETPTTRVPVLVAGLAVAAVAMLAVQVLYMVLSGAPPAWLPFAALLIVISVPTAGAALGWLGSRITRDASERRAALVFGALGLVGGALWGSFLGGGLAGQLTSAGASGSLVLGSALVVGVTAAIGAVMGRLAAREAADRPVLVVVLGAVVVAVAALGLL
ncbi:hypothetical protein [Cellulosimicrobium arenosum]|uniref:Uncharacterized protein n=1 Tax=Cellulosimicrobium arenosum TaxID=2708133 RepID=A0A927PFU4_9MICO|nr:hypothetical protein [Cellulosimicrobium arenosum]MBD8080266.1 hypothetical protein [Cellulosimicrobium arenosum]